MTRVVLRGVQELPAKCAAQEEGVHGQSGHLMMVVEVYGGGVVWLRSEAIHAGL